MKKLLVAFDFDHTIINDNSDIEIRKLVSSSKIPDRVKSLYKLDGWTKYMREIFIILQQNNITEKKIRHECQKFKPTGGMVQLIETLKTDFNCDIIIISDSNSVLIEEWLKSANLEKHITKVFTNPAYFNSDGLLEIDMYHVQDWCEISTVNLCKGSILETFIRDSSDDYEFVVYVGDGRNDLCPALKMNEPDILFPRVGYSLMKLIEEGKHDLKPRISPWSNGLEILSILQQYKDNK